MLPGRTFPSMLGAMLPGRYGHAGKSLPAFRGSEEQAASCKRKVFACYVGWKAWSLCWLGAAAFLGVLVPGYAGPQDDSGQETQPRTEQAATTGQPAGQEPDPAPAEEAGGKAAEKDPPEPKDPTGAEEKQPSAGSEGDGPGAETAEPAREPVPEPAEEVVVLSRGPELEPGLISYFEPDVALGSVVVSDISLVHLLRGISRDKGVNLMVDETIDLRVNLNLSGRRSGLNLLLDTLVHLYPIRCERVGDFVYVRPLKSDRESRNDIFYNHKDDTISFDLSGIALERLARNLTEITGHTVFYRSRYVDPQTGIRGYQARLPFKKGLATLMGLNGFGLREAEGIYEIGRIQGVSRRGELVDIWFESTPLGQVLRDIADLGFPIMLMDELEGSISIDIRGVTVEKLLDLLLADSRYHYTVREGIFLIGQNTSPLIHDTEVIRYNNVHAKIIEDLLPAPLKEELTVSTIKELNSILISGEPSKVRTLAAVARNLDRHVAQVLLEVLVVEYNVNDNFELGLRLNVGDQQVFPTLTDFTLNGFRDEAGDYRITRLPSDFTIRLNALQQEDMVRMITKPHIATLSGNQAEMVIGQTLYYRVESEELVGTQTPSVRTAQKIESVDANTLLSITPWVMGEDLLTVEIRSTFDSFAGSVVDNVPPAKDVSTITSTVTLRDGETIILAGQVINSQTRNREGLPFLSKIPLLGALFRNRKKQTVQSERIVYITPHIYFLEEESEQYVRDRAQLDWHLQSKHPFKRGDEDSPGQSARPAQPPVTVPASPSGGDLPKYLDRNTPIVPRALALPPDRAPDLRTEESRTPAGRTPAGRTPEGRTPAGRTQGNARMHAASERAEVESEPGLTGQPSHSESGSEASGPPTRKADPETEEARYAETGIAGEESEPVPALAEMDVDEPGAQMEPSRDETFQQDGLRDTDRDQPIVVELAEDRKAAETEASPEESEHGAASRAPARVRLSELDVATADFAVLAERMLAELRASHARYAIAFYSACERSTLAELLRNRHEPEVRILPRRIGGRDCYIFIWGSFESFGEASERRESLPESLPRSGDETWVLDLSPYLEPAEPPVPFSGDAGSEDPGTERAVNAGEARASSVKTKTGSSESKSRSMSYKALAEEMLAELHDAGARYAIAFLTACQNESLERFFSENRDRDVRILPKRLSGRHCYVFVWGAFRNFSSAQAMHASLPERLRFPGERAWIVDLDEEVFQTEESQVKAGD